MPKVKSELKLWIGLFGIGELKNLGIFDCRFSIEKNQKSKMTNDQ